MKKEHSTPRSVIFTPHNTRKIAENKKIMVGYECTLGEKKNSWKQKYLFS